MVIVLKLWRLSIFVKEGLINFLVIEVLLVVCLIGIEVGGDVGVGVGFLIGRVEGMSGLRCLEGFRFFLMVLGGWIGFINIR